jgi:hypothetical protein
VKAKSAQTEDISKRQGQGRIKSKKIKRLDIREATRQSGNITVKLEYTCTTIKGINNITQTRIIKGQCSEILTWVFYNSIQFAFSRGIILSL